MNQNDTHSRFIPLLIIAGFLGAGKTTLINRLLRETSNRTLVLENEFGDVGVDGDLLEASSGRVLELSGGCACCTLQLQLVSLLAQLADQSHGIDRVVVEPSGLADPAGILAALQAEAVRRAFRVSGIVTVVDASAPPADHPDRWLWERQIGLADRVVLTRSGAPGAPDVLAAVRAANGLAAVARAETVTSEWILAPRARVGGQPPPDADEARGFSSVAVEVAGPVVLERVRAWMTLLALGADAPIVRIKGTLRIAGSDRRHVAHATLTGVSIEPDARPAPAQSRLVLIGRHLDAQKLARAFDRCAAVRAGPGPLIPFRG